MSPVSKFGGSLRYELQQSRFGNSGGLALRSTIAAFRGCGKGGSTARLVAERQEEASKQIVTYQGTEMEALRLITESHNHRLVIDLPASMENCRLEVIVMPAESIQAVESRRRRAPSPMLAGTVSLKDDLIAPASPEGDWDALQ